MRNIKMIIQYRGTNYAGFQKQPDHPTIQETLNRVLSQILQEDIDVIGSGRTDAGVHAKGQVINFVTGSGTECGRLKWSANSLLPEDIVIKEAEEVAKDFHARRSAVSRKYRYLVLNRDYRSPFRGDYSYFFSQDLDIEAMQKGSKILIGEHDFSSFCVAVSKPECCIRYMKSIEILRDNDLVYFDFEANAFLHNMVRVIVGTLIEVGTGEIEVEDMVKILDAKDRKKAGATAPAHGLTLMQVIY